MRDLYSIGSSPSFPPSRRTKQRAKALFASSAGGIMGVTIKGNGRIDLPNRETRPAHTLLSPIHERNRERAGWLTSLRGK
jgi:hypothetical protein